MKQIIQKLREKLELDNPNRYVNGYYQMSKIQKRIWIYWLFIIATLFWSARAMVIFDQRNYSPDVVVQVILFSSFVVVILSYLALLLLMGSIKFGNKLFFDRVANIEEVTKYIIWTIFLFAIMAEIVFKIRLPFVGFLF